MTAPDLSPDNVMRTVDCPECNAWKGYWCWIDWPKPSAYPKSGFVHPSRVTAAFDLQQPQEGQSLARRRWMRRLRVGWNLMASWETEGKSDEYYTPQYVFDALGCRFELDPASTNSPHQCVPADVRLVAGGLDVSWRGAFVWMNPPFGKRNGVVPWLDKFFANGNGIALTPDRTSAPWFRDAWSKADLVMFTPKISFVLPDGSTAKQPGCGTALWAIGATAQHALLLAQKAGLGIIAKPQLELIESSWQELERDEVRKLR